MATVNYVDAQFGGATVRFSIPAPANRFEQGLLNAQFGTSAGDVYDRLRLGQPLDFGTDGDVARVLMLAYGGEGFPMRGTDSTGGDASGKKYQRARPWVLIQPGSNMATLVAPAQSTYRSLALKILQAFLFGNDTSAATWSPGA